jgi:hypothetical protein
MTDPDIGTAARHLGQRTFSLRYWRFATCPSTVSAKTPLI